MQDRDSSPLPLKGWDEQTLYNFPSLLASLVSEAPGTAWGYSFRQVAYRLGVQIRSSYDQGLAAGLAGDFSPGENESYFLYRDEYHAYLEKVKSCAGPPSQSGWCPYELLDVHIGREVLSQPGNWVAI